MALRHEEFQSDMVYLVLFGSGRCLGCEMWIRVEFLGTSRTSKCYQGCNSFGHCKMSFGCMMVSLYDCQGDSHVMTFFLSFFGIYVEWVYYLHQLQCAGKYVPMAMMLRMMVRIKEGENDDHDSMMMRRRRRMMMRMRMRMRRMRMRRKRRMKLWWYR